MRKYKHNYTPIYFSPTEVGNDIYYSKQQLLDDLSDIEVNPLKEIYLRDGEDEALRMWGPLTVIHAVEGDEWFLLSEWGNVTIDSEGTPHSPHRLMAIAVTRNQEMPHGIQQL